MSTQPTIRTAAAATILAALSVSVAHADAAVFHDVLKPNGHTRSQAAKAADGANCGMVKGRGLTVMLPVFVKCMAAKGWAFDHVRPDPKTRPRSGTNVDFTDTRGDANQHPRSNGVLQADTRTCRAGYRSAESKVFKQCMAAHGWEYLYSQRAPVRIGTRPVTGRPLVTNTSRGRILRRAPVRTPTITTPTSRMRPSRRLPTPMNASIAATNAQQAADQSLQNAIQNTVVNPQ